MSQREAIKSQKSLLSEHSPLCLLTMRVLLAYRSTFVIFATVASICLVLLSIRQSFSAATAQNEYDSPAELKTMGQLVSDAPPVDDNARSAVLRTSSRTPAKAEESDEQLHTNKAIAPLENITNQASLHLVVEPRTKGGHQKEVQNMHVVEQHDDAGAVLPSVHPKMYQGSDITKGKTITKSTINSTIVNNNTVSNSTAVSKNNVAAAEEETDVDQTQLRPTVFYNVYLPEKSYNRAYAIIQEQLEQLANSYAASSGPSNLSTEVFYKTIGTPANHSFLNQLCDDNNLNCTHIGHHDKGFEMITQQSMLEYCKKHTSRRVIYLHPKGSFHVKEGQDEWRRELTTAATSQNCTDPPDSRCNLCGLDFQPTWGPIFMGTMFQAKCSYVAKLFSPLKVARMMNKAYKQRPANLTANLYRYMPYTAGEERYAAELFIGNHPDVMACDGTGSLAPKSAWPSHNHTVNLEWQASYSNSSKAHAREWFLLGGLLWKYHSFYKATPPDNSWVWWYFPDGRKWQMAVKKYGVPNAVKHASLHNEVPR